MSDGIQIVYDGECPFCSRYVAMAHLRESVGSVDLIDARSDHPLVAEIKALGFDLNEGMLARYGGQNYYGADCVHLLSLLSSRDTFAGRLIARTFSSQTVTRRLYPFMRFGRNMTLRLLGRSRIS